MAPRVKTLLADSLDFGVVERLRAHDRGREGLGCGFIVLLGIDHGDGAGAVTQGGFRAGPFRQMRPATGVPARRDSPKTATPAST